MSLNRDTPPLITHTLISDGIRTTAVNLAPFIVIALIFNLPAIIWGYWINKTMQEMAQSLNAIGDLDVHPNWLEPYRFGAQMVLREISQWVLNVISQAAMVYGTVQYLSGHKASFMQTLVKGLSKILPALGVAVLGWSFILMGYVCFVVPGLILMCALFVSVPAAVMERRGIMGSIKRSFELTRGSRGPIFLYFIILGSAIYILKIIILLVMGEGLQAWLLTQSVSVLMGMLTAVIGATAYARLREHKEGADIMDLAKIFD